MELIKSLEKSKRIHFCIAGARIRCTLTGHELPPSSDALLSYANGKKFERALASLAAKEAAPAELRKFLTDSGQSSQLFCQLTCRFLADTPADIARHLAGRRFQLALQAYEAARASGRPFRPSSSLFAKHRRLFTLDGVATGKEASDDEAEAEDDQAVLMDAESEDTDDGDEEQPVESDADSSELEASPPLQEPQQEQPTGQPHAADRKRKAGAAQAGRDKSANKKNRMER